MEVFNFITITVLFGTLDHFRSKASNAVTKNGSSINWITTTQYSKNTVKPELTTPPNSNHLSTATTLKNHNSHTHSIKLPLNNDPLFRTATILGSRGWPLYSGLTVVQILENHYLTKCDWDLKKIYFFRSVKFDVLAWTRS